MVRTALDRAQIVLTALFANLPIELDGYEYFLRQDEDNRLVICARFEVEDEDEDDWEEADRDDEDLYDFIEVDLDLGDVLRCTQKMDEEYLLQLQAQTLVHKTLHSLRRVRIVAEEESEE